MNATKDTIDSVKGTSTLVRAKFGPGMLLQHEDLEQLNAYTRELSRLMFRSLFGCGVVCGLVVTSETKCGKAAVTVAPGVALDCDGDPIHLPKAQSLTIDDECNPEIPARLWVILCSNTKCCSPRTPVCTSDDDESPKACTRERDGFELRIVSKLPPCICGCPEQARPDPNDNECRCADPRLPCYRDHYAGKCGCHGGEECECSCDCVLLAQLDKPSREGEPWTVEHRVRRFVRPVLMRDPEVGVGVGVSVGVGNGATSSPALAPKEQPVKSSRTAKPRQRA
jgi:hypothetical protein